MKKTVALVLALSLFATAFAQTGLEITRDAQGHKILKGFMDRKQLAADTAFSWYAQNTKGFTPNADVVKQIAANKEGVNLIVFGGTWCGDTQYLLPRFFATTDAASLTDAHITLLGVDRNKKTLYNLTEAFGITNVPTVIVMKNGKEVGRVVEYGKTGSPEKELGEILAGVK